MPDKHEEGGIPPLHLTMIYIVSALTALAMLGYFFAPAGKSEFYNTMAFGGLTFLCGKFSNGFGKPVLPRKRKETDNNE